MSKVSTKQEYYLVERPSEDFFCPVTLDLMLHPYLTACCGKHLLREAVVRIEGEGGACPLCKKPDLSTMLDKHYLRQVNELHVFCHNVDRGCEWQGELSDLKHHVQSCPISTAPLKSKFLDYHNISIDKSHCLGTGSYAAVYRAKCDELLCAAKVMHGIPSSRDDHGTSVPLQKFLKECQLHSMIRHPNIVQYLQTCTDEESGHPVLLMELCDESLTTFLEQSPDLLPYHIQLNICHDIALALVYLHSNGLLHRSLTSNNVLMDHGKAKVTDFGMSKLTGIQVRPTTKCPGNPVYMPPEALTDPPQYTEKLDIFSFGVLVVQIITREFPNPKDRYTTEVVPPSEQFPDGVSTGYFQRKLVALIIFT